jgi:hypothetical protein
VLQGSERLATGEEPVNSTSWGQDRRLQFIEFRVQWDGKLNRSDLTDFFGISVPQASLDLARYMEAAPHNLLYDKSSRSYVASPGFRPLFTHTSPSQFLHELLARASGISGSETSFMGWQPAVAIAPRPSRMVDAKTLVTIIAAIRNQSRIEVTYQSMRSDQPSERALSPHAVGHDGFRWHVRAYCHLRDRFQDFVIARILAARNAGSSNIDRQTDTQWNRVLSLILTANPKLPSGARKAVELDYGMDAGQLTLECRHALLFYTLRNLRLEKATEEDPAAAQITLKNRQELQPFLSEVLPVG